MYALPILLGCSVPREAEVGSSNDFESHSAIYVCDGSDEHYWQETIWETTSSVTLIQPLKCSEAIKYY